MRTIAILLSALLLAVSLPAVEHQAPSGPRLQLSTDTIHIGVVTTREPVQTYTVGLTNVGTAPLQIDAIRVSCACTQVDTISLELAPKESYQLHIRLDLSPFFPMEVEKPIRFYSNDPNSPAELVLVGEYREP